VAAELSAARLAVAVLAAWLGARRLAGSLPGSDPPRARRAARRASPPPGGQGEGEGPHPSRAPPNPWPHPAPTPPQKTLRPAPHRPLEAARSPGRFEFSKQDSYVAPCSERTPRGPRGSRFVVQSGSLSIAAATRRSRRRAARRACA